MIEFVLLAASLVLFGYAIHELRPTAPRPPGDMAGRAASLLVSPARLWSLERRASAHPTLSFGVLGVLSIMLWLVLYGWYSLPGYGATPDFAFDKIPNHFDSPALRLTALIFLLIVLIYAAGYLLLGRLTRISRRLKLIIVASLVAVVGVNILLYPVGALDVYNYIVELKLTYHYHQNPYVSTFAPYTSDPAAKFAFFLDMPLFYGPAWLVLSALPTVLTGFGSVTGVLVGLKIFNALLLGVTAYVVYRYQDDETRGWQVMWLFIGNPLVLFEGIGNAHNDVMMGLFLVGAAFALKRRSVWAGPLLTLSILVKFFTGALIPLFIVAMLRARWNRREIALTCILSVLVLGIVVAPYWAGGHMVSGLLQGTNASQGMSSASLFSLAREYLSAHNAPVDAITSVRQLFLGLFALSILTAMWLQWRGMPDEEAMIDVFVLFSVLVSLLYPWYLIPVVGLIALQPDRVAQAFLLAATTLGLLYHPLSVWAWFNSGFPVFGVHLFQASLLALPIVIFVLFDGYRHGIMRPRRAPPESM